MMANKDLLMSRYMYANDRINRDGELVRGLHQLKRDEFTREEVSRYLGVYLDGVWGKEENLKQSEG